MITYKYNLGDVVKFKDKFHSPTCGLKGLEGTTGVVEERRDYNGPCYKLAGMDSFCKESCFEGPALSKTNESDDRAKYRELYLKALKKTYGKVPFETETVEVGSLLEFTEAVLKTTKEV